VERIRMDYEETGQLGAPRERLRDNRSHRSRIHYMIGHLDERSQRRYAAGKLGIHSRDDADLHSQLAARESGRLQDDRDLEDSHDLRNVIARKTVKRAAKAWMLSSDNDEAYAQEASVAKHMKTSGVAITFNNVRTPRANTNNNNNNTINWPHAPAGPTHRDCRPE
jgi:hypothetical protein